MVLLELVAGSPFPRRRQAGVSRLVSRLCSGEKLLQRTELVACVYCIL